jgi:hypothetical protein
MIATIAEQSTGSLSSEAEGTLPRADGAVDPARVRLFRGPHGVLRCTLAGEKTVLRAKVVRAFPLSHQSRWISVLDAKNKEVCLVEDPGALDDESRRLALDELERHYCLPVIRRINSVKNEYRTMFWDVETDRGHRDFVMKWASDTILWLSATELILVDVDANRLCIPDVSRLDRRSRQQMSLLE